MTDEILLDISEKLDKLSSIESSLIVIQDYLVEVTHWIVVHIGVIIPGILITALFYWALSQFMERYY